MKTLGKWAWPLIALVALTMAAATPAQATGHPADRSAQTGRVIHIKGIHVIHTHAQAHRYLGKTPKRFRGFVVHRSAVLQQREEQAGASPSCVRRTGVVVTKYHTSGYALGGEGGCGGVATLYTDYGKGAHHGGSWRMVKATQDSFYCPVLKRYLVPSALVGTSCYSPSRHREVHYHQA